MYSTRHNIYSAICGAFFLSLILGCVTTQQLSWNHARDTTYRKHVRDWTRTDKIYDGIIARSTVMVTCFSPAFVGELQKERSERAQHSPEVTEEKILTARKNANNELVFFVALHTQNFYWNDLQANTPTFKVTLSNGTSKPIRPKSIQRLNDNQMADWSTLFPSVSPLDTGYFVRFPPVDGKSVVRLLISGDPGAMEMTWRLNR